MINQKKRLGRPRFDRWLWTITTAAPIVLVATIFFAVSARAQGTDPPVVTDSGSYSLTNNQEHNVVNGASGHGSCTIHNQGPSSVTVTHTIGGVEKTVEITAGNSTSVGVDKGTDVSVKEGAGSSTAEGTWEFKWVKTDFPEVPPTPVDD